jgi:hypothetical protein
VAEIKRDQWQVRRINLADVWEVAMGLEMAAAGSEVLVDHESISEVLWPRAAGWPPRSLVAELTVSWSRSLIGQRTSLKSASSNAVVELLEATIIYLETAIDDRPSFPCLSVCDLVGSSTETTPISRLRTPREHLAVCSSHHCKFFG